MKILLEGLTGTGKSQTIAALSRLGLVPPLVVPEEETFGDFMEELTDPSKDDAFRLRRLEAVRPRLRQEPSFLLERFHVSYYALLPRWPLYAAIDAELADLGVTLVLLWIDEPLLRSRSLLREEYDGADWQALVQHFGSEDNALAALRLSQQRRFEALARTGLRSMTIDTAAKDWDAYARQIAAAT
jgi:hypothetical protein